MRPEEGKPTNRKGETAMKFLTAFVLAVIVLAAMPVIAQEGGSAETNMEILLEKVKADKKLLVAANMELTDEEAKKFWPLYEEYQKEVQKQNERLGKAIMDYADAYNKGPVPNDLAKKLMNEVISIEEAEAKTKKNYAEKIGKVIPAAKTARYMQIETKIRAALKYELAKQIPLVN
jgi:hypothetical protein